jgi:thiamine-phosphate pyrophosphorylase
VNGRHGAPLSSGAFGPRPFFYPIIDTEVCREYRQDPLHVALACLRGGAPWLQLRAKEERGAPFLALADAVVSAAGDFRARIVINDRADIALMAGAAGVHVGQDDLPVAAIRQMVGPSVVVGLSTHDEQQADLAIDSSADYIAVGPVYGTTSKDTGYDARGLDLVRHAAGRGKPVVAIGGITLARARDVVAAGATAIAVISDVLRGDPERRARQFVDLLHV